MHSNSVSQHRTFSNKKKKKSLQSKRKHKRKSGFTSMQLFNLNIKLGSFQQKEKENDSCRIATKFINNSIKTSPACTKLSSMLILDNPDIMEKKTKTKFKHP